MQALRRREMDVLTTAEAGNNGLLDPEQLAFAAGAGRVLYTFNVGDYAQLHAEGRTHAGLILVPQQRAEIGVQLRALLSLYVQHDADAMRGALHFLALHRYR